MNVIGQFGRFITEYQNPIQIVLIIALLAAGSYAIIKAVIDAREKREILSQIKETVTEINAVVNNLGEKKADVIYIDNRVPGQAPYEAASGKQDEDIASEKPHSHDGNRDAEEPYEETEKAVDEVCPEVPTEIPVDDVEIPVEDVEIPIDDAEIPMDDVEIRVEDVEIPVETEQAVEEDAATEDSRYEKGKHLQRRYFSRDCAVSKNGKTYTIQELNEQIKE